MNSVILDHSSTARNIIYDELVLDGLEILSTSDPYEAWEWVQNGDVEFLTTSQELEGMSGLDLIQKIRKNHFAKPVLSLITSHIDKEFVENAYDYGADIVIPKLFTKGDLRYCFRRILKPGDYLDSILVIDDSTIIRKILKHSLEKSEFRILEADSISGGLKILQSEFERIGLVVSDENMEEGNGSDLCYNIRKNPRMASMPFFLVSGEEAEKLEELSRLTWINGFFVKPVESSTVLQAARLFRKKWYSHRMNFRTALPHRSRDLF